MYSIVSDIHRRSGVISKLGMASVLGNVHPMNTEKTVIKLINWSWTESAVKPKETKKNNKKRNKKS